MKINGLTYYFLLIFLLFCLRSSARALVVMSNLFFSEINSKNFLDTVAAKIHGDGERVIENREERIHSLQKNKTNHRRI